MPAELAQTLANAVLLIGVTLVAGTIGLRRFEAMEHRFEASAARHRRPAHGVEARHRARRFARGGGSC